MNDRTLNCFLLTRTKGQRTDADSFKSGRPTSCHHYRGSLSELEIWQVLKGRLSCHDLNTTDFGKKKKNLSCILTYSLANVTIKNLECSWMVIVIKWSVNTRLDISEVPILCWPSLPKPCPASSVRAREGAGCGSVGAVSGAWLLPQLSSRLPFGPRSQASLQRA